MFITAFLTVPYLGVNIEKWPFHSLSGGWGYFSKEKSWNLTQSLGHPHALSFLRKLGLFCIVLFFSPDGRYPFLPLGIWESVGLIKSTKKSSLTTDLRWEVQQGASAVSSPPKGQGLLMQIIYLLLEMSFVYLGLREGKLEKKLECLPPTHICIAEWLTQVTLCSPKICFLFLEKKEERKKKRRKKETISTEFKQIKIISS